MPDVDKPVFPLEIEEMIFLLAAQTDWKSAKNFILVAKRVHEWLIPQIYKVATFHPVDFSPQRPRFESRNLVYHGKHVQHLMLYDMRADLSLLRHTSAACLEWCPNASNIAIWTSRGHYDSLLINQLRASGRHLTHLSIDLESFQIAFAHHAFVTGIDTSSSPISFPHLTHLELIVTPKNIDIQTFKERFPALTHVALKWIAYPPTAISLDILKVYKNQIQVLIWYQRPSENTEPAVLPKPPNHFGYDEPRLVLVSYGMGFVRTWYEGAIGGLGIWKVAEEAIAALRVGRPV